VDLRSPDPDSPAPDFAAYIGEDRELFQAVCAVAHNVKVVLSKAIRVDRNGNLVADRNIYDGTGHCKIPGGNVQAGFLTLPTDLRRVPLSVKAADGSITDSFSLAAARLLNKKQYPRSLDVENLPYGVLHRAEEFDCLPASYVLNGSLDARNPDKEAVRAQATYPNSRSI
jgi:hypothetical protein